MSRKPCCKICEHYRRKQNMCRKTGKATRGNQSCEGIRETRHVAHEAQKVG